MGLKDLPIMKRPREKAFLFGIESLTDEEVLAIIISSGCKNLDVLELAHQLLKKYHSLSELSLLDINEISSLTGIKKVKAIKLLASFELCRRIDKERMNDCRKINSVQEIIKIMKPYIFNLKNEKVFIILLNHQNGFLGVKELSNGGDISVNISSRQIISTALKYNASKIVIIHNHPSDNVKPSIEDINSTNNIIITCNLMGIKVIEHFIFTKNMVYGILTEKTFSY